MSNKKRLERDLRHKVLGGVCSGLGNYFNLDPAFWRVLFFFLFLMGCLGLPIYLILWIVMPGSNTIGVTADADQLASTDDGTQPKKNSGNMTVGLTLIGVGVICLVSRYIPAISWRTAWPIILIVLGLLLIIPFKSKQS